jgi:hypothetical protein
MGLWQHLGKERYGICAYMVYMCMYIYVYIVYTIYMCVYYIYYIYVCILYILYICVYIIYTIYMCVYCIYYIYVCILYILYICVYIVYTIYMCVYCIYICILYFQPTVIINSDQSGSVAKVITTISTCFDNVSVLSLTEQGRREWEQVFLFFSF